MNNLIKIEEVTAVQVYVENGVDPILDQIREEVESFVPDLSTVTGRKKVASLANKVARSKTLLDSLGKDLVSEQKAQIKLVDSERKRIRDTLDELKVFARKPLTEWEEEQARIEAEKAAVEEAERISAEINQAHEVALLLNEKFDRDAKEAEEKAEAQRLAAEKEAAENAKRREQEIAREAEERAKAEAERKAAQEKERAQKEIQEAKRREQQAIEEVERQKKQAEQQARIAAENERRRIEQERIDKEEAERKRAADIEHRKSVNNAALKCMVSETGLTEDQCKLVISAIAKGLISNITVNY